LVDLNTAPPPFHTHLTINGAVAALKDALSMPHEISCFGRAELLEDDVQLKIKRGGPIYCLEL